MWRDAQKEEKPNPLFLRPLGDGRKWEEYDCRQKEEEREMQNAATKEAPLKHRLHKLRCN